MTKTALAPHRRTVGLLLALFLLLAACSGGDSAESFAIESGLAGGFASAETTTTAASADTTSPDVGAPSSDRQAAGEESAQSPTGDGDLGTGGITPPLAQTAVDLGRDIVFTADLSVAVDDVAKASGDATRAIQSLGGFLFGQESTGGAQPRSLLVFKVFPEDFQEALDRLGSIGDLRSQRVSADDVTERVVDLQSRITTAEASVDRLRGFLDNATDVKTIADLENQLLQRETQLETLRGQLRTLDDAVSLATITLEITESTILPGVRVDVTAYSGDVDGGLSCPGSAGLVVDQGGAVTVCFEIVNVGETDLTRFELRDPVIDIARDDLIPVFGDLDQTLEPGESIVVAAHITADRSWRTQTTVTALPVDDDGTVREGRSVSNTATIAITAADPGGVPGFGEGIQRSLGFLVVLVQLLVYLVATLIPFAWIPLVIWWLLRRGRPKMKETPPTETPAPEEEPVSARD